MFIVGLKIYILLKQFLYTSKIELEINTVLPENEGANIVARVGSLGTKSPYLDCLHVYSFILSGSILVHLSLLLYIICILILY